MLLAAAGILYARLTGRRLIIDWSDAAYSNDGSNVFPLLFQCPSSSPVEELPLTDSVAPAIWRGQVRRSVIGLEKGSPGDGNAELERYPRPRNRAFREASSIDPTRLDYDEQILVMWGRPLRVEDMRAAHQAVVPAFPRGSTAEILRNLFARELIPQPLIRERVDHFKRERFHGRVVGVHVRHTDKESLISRLFKQLDELVARDRDLLLFLATDNADVKATIEQRYGAVTVPHWYPAPGSQLHESSACPDRFENGIEALVDLYLLAECDHLICDTTSLFAQVATLLTKAPAHSVVDVSSGRWRRRLRKVRARMRHRFAVPGRRLPV
jgi:hypothetical protein